MHIHQFSAKAHLLLFQVGHTTFTPDEVVRSVRLLAMGVCCSNQDLPELHFSNGRIQGYYDPMDDHPLSSIETSYDTLDMNHSQFAPTAYNLGPHDKDPE